MFRRLHRLHYNGGTNPLKDPYITSMGRTPVARRNNIGIDLGYKDHLMDQMTKQVHRGWY